MSAFEATGNSDENHRAPPNKKGEVVVTFDELPTKMSFDLPGHIKMISENGIPYINGATETYIPDEGFHEGASYESWNDHNNEFSRMWIESANEARIVVRHRCALMKVKERKSVIVHSDKKKVTPYGPGNWTDEWYVFYPDGTHVRRIKIWTAVARQAGHLALGKQWPYELEGMYLWWGVSPHGTKVSDHLEDGMITLIRMNGDHKTINIKPYPLKVKEYDNMNKPYGEFVNANIHVINTKSKYRPWRMGRPSDKLYMTPYVPVHPMTQLVPAFPQDSGNSDNYSVAGLGQMTYLDYWQLENDSFSEVWLNGWTDSKQPADELAMLARSWWDAPKASLAMRNGARVEGYDVAERAYLIDAGGTRTSKSIDLKIRASKTSPLINPAFLINHWGDDKASLAINGKAIPEGKDFRLGHYRELTLQDGSKWQDVLVAWVRTSAEVSTRVTITAPRPVVKKAEPPGMRIWTSTEGTEIKARLLKDSGRLVLLKGPQGQLYQVRRTMLSKRDQDYLDGLK